MKKKDNKSEAGMRKYLFVSVVAHLAIIYFLSSFAGEKPAFQIYPMEYYSEVQVVHYDDQTGSEQNDFKLEEEAEQELTKEQEEAEKVEEVLEDELEEVEDEATPTEEEAEVTESEELAEVAEEEVVDEVKEEGTELDEEVLTSDLSEEEIKVNEDEETEEQIEEQEEVEEEKPTEEEPELTESEEVKEAEEAEETEETETPPVARDFITTKITPSYPKDAANLAQEGTVRLLVTVKSDGEIKEVELLESAENSQFNNVAELTVERGWQFKPAESDYQIELLVDFKYTDQQSDVELEFIDLFFVEE
ncbi:energy transducer TonB [Natroniella sulfidigena]|uniref:energy transducer TonB n=1 Tax=Natroniella sulfidigena TaxID=723921 RepID=UPI00200B3ABF|nr:energy transducer TonB [Natroniella sulfidigena]MCK8817702.1 energy transducer TonB [Natroniella sulfidigena]